MIKSVVAIPLLEERALSVVKTISSRNAALSRPSLLPKSSTTDSVADDTGQELNEQLAESPSSPHVQFSPDPHIKLVTPIREGFKEDELRPDSPQSTASSISTPSSEQSIATSPIFKTVAARLSFWNRLSKRNGDSIQDTSLPTTPPPQSAAQEQEVLDKIIQEAKEEPGEVIETILATTAPAPATAEEQHSELENKVIRECIREFTKGGMYFSYAFGTLFEAYVIYQTVLTMRQMLRDHYSTSKGN